MRRNSDAGKKINRWMGGYVLALVFLIALLFMPGQAGNAQEPTPTAAVTVTATETEPAVPEEEASQQAQSSGVTSRVLVTISPRARIWTVMERVGGFGKATERAELSKLGVFIMEVPAENLEERMKQIRNTSGVQYVEPEQWVYATDTIPNDPGFANQYGLAAIRAPQGWDYSTGSNSVTIAILDSGVDYGHMDLAGKIDAGHNFIACPDTNIPCPFLPQDDYGHGTHVAGIAAASTNNGVGIAGVSWGARIMPLKVLNSSGGGTFENVSAAIVWAVDHGAQVINLSLGGSAYSAVLENAVLYAYGNNVLMAASSGNTGINFVLYPARFPQVIAVGASNMSNQPASFSNYGPEVDLAAPGDFIYSTLPGGYGFRTGTSMSAPHVSGLASILFGYVTSADSVRGIIESTALDIGPIGWDDFSGAGLIQMDAAIALVAPPLSTPTSTSTLTSTLTSMPTGSGGGLFNPPGFLPFPGYSLPTGTFTPLPSLSPATETQTVSPPGQTPTPTPTSTPTQIPAQDVTPLWGNKINRLKIFLSPVFCGAVFMILLGIWLFWRAGKHVHNKFVMKF